MSEWDLLNKLKGKEKYKNKGLIQNHPSSETK